MATTKGFRPLTAFCSGLVMVGCLVGCSPAAPQPAAAPPSPAGSAPGPAPADTPSGTSAAAPSATSEAQSSGGGQCRLDDLGATREDARGYVAGMNRMVVVWTNRSGSTCTMTGFGGVDLVDARGRHYSASRAEANPSPVSLPPGGQAHTLISYVASGGTGVFTPTTILATPPNETRSASIAWPQGIGVPYFDAPSATEFSISPVEPNAS